eukprot:2071619-Pyramimonas_sp.AAC.1
MAFSIFSRSVCSFGSASSPRQLTKCAPWVLPLAPGTLAAPSSPSPKSERCRGPRPRACRTSAAAPRALIASWASSPCDRS